MANYIIPYSHWSFATRLFKLSYTIRKIKRHYNILITVLMSAVSFHYLLRKAQKVLKGFLKQVCHEKYTTIFYDALFCLHVIFMIGFYKFPNLTLVISAFSYEVYVHLILDIVQEDNRTISRGLYFLYSFIQISLPSQIFVWNSDASRHMEKKKIRCLYSFQRSACSEFEER